MTAAGLANVDLLGPLRAEERQVRVWKMTLLGPPVAKGRGRIVKLGNHMGIATPPKTRAYETRVRQAAKLSWRGRPPIAEQPVTLVVTAFFPIPASWPRARRDAAAAHQLRPISKPDADNVLKSISDGLNEIVFVDDSQIVDSRVVKWYDANPRVEVILEW